MPYQWVQLTNAPFAGRDGLGLISGYFNGSVEELYMYGGWNPYDSNNFPTTTCNEIWKANNITTGDWSLVRKQGAFSSRHNFCVIEDFGGFANIYGADIQAGRYINDHWTSGNRRDYKIVQENCPWGPRVLGIGVRFKNDILMIGGQTLPGYCGPGDDLVEYKDIWAYERGGQGTLKGWRQVNSNCPALPRSMIERAVVHNNELYLFTGGRYDPRSYDTGIWRTVGGSLTNWEKVPVTPPWAGRVYSSILSWDAKLWVVCGSGNSGNLGDTWHSSDNGATWVEVASSLPPRHAAGLVVFNNKPTLVGGNGSPMRNDVWVLNKT